MVKRDLRLHKTRTAHCSGLPSVRRRTNESQQEGWVEEAKCGGSLCLTPRRKGSQLSVGQEDASDSSQVVSGLALWVLIIPTPRREENVVGSTRRIGR